MTGKPQKTERKLIIVGVVFNDKQEILLTQRFDPEFADAHMKWDLPGGSHEVGETLEQTVARELLEETGYKVRVERMLPYHMEYTWRSEQRVLEVVILGFVCRLVSGTPHTNDHKIHDLKWVAHEDLGSYESLVGTPEFIAAAQQKLATKHTQP